MDNRNRRPSFTRHCIFCGEPPVKKNKEHVIPLWLIRLTGDPNRQIHISVATDDPDHLVRKFAFDQFTFPSCTRCNSEFETLEGAVKPIIIAMLDGEALDSDHIALIMDWLIKSASVFGSPIDTSMATS